MLFAMSDDTILKLATLIVGCIGSCFTGWVAWQMAIVKTRQKDAVDLHAQDAQEVKNSLSDVKGAVNGQMNAYKAEIKDAAKEVLLNSDAKATALELAGLKQEIALLKQHITESPNISNVSVVPVAPPVNGGETSSA